MKKILVLLIGILMIGCGEMERVAKIDTKFGEIMVEFYPDVAPKHVESFITHAENGYFDGSAFHRVIPGFVIQGGDPNSKDDDRSNDGTGGHAAKYYGFGDKDDPETWVIPAEFNNVPHNRGALSMARTSDPNSAGSQFFICVANVNRLDNQYTVFGKVISGMDVVDQIVNVERDQADNPLEKVAMTVTIHNKEDLKK